jgi:hypothetical protein
VDPGCWVVGFAGGAPPARAWLDGRCALALNGNARRTATRQMFLIAAPVSGLGIADTSIVTSMVADW